MGIQPNQETLVIFGAYEDSLHSIRLAEKETSPTIQSSLHKSDALGNETFGLHKIYHSSLVNRPKDNGVLLYKCIPFRCKR